MSDPAEPTDWDEEEDDAIDAPTHCAACGKPAEGFAMINDERFCHPDDGPSCYMGQTTTNAIETGAPPCGHTTRTTLTDSAGTASASSFAASPPSSKTADPLIAR